MIDNKGEQKNLEIEILEPSSQEHTPKRFEAKNKETGETLLIITDNNREIELDIDEEYNFIDATIYTQKELKNLYSEEKELANKHSCPNCGGEMQYKTNNQTVSLDVLDDLEGFDFDLYLYVTEETIVNKLNQEDDWIPHRKKRHGSRDIGLFECQECRFKVIQAKHDSKEELEHRLEEGIPKGVHEDMAVNRAPSNDLGMSVGGAKDATSFRENILNDYTPQKDSLTYEGLFYDYYFYTGNDVEEDELFYPTYSTAVSEHPLTFEKEQYITVGLNSNLKMDEFERKKLNLVVVLDVSGSMSSSFRDYYYDRHGIKKERESDSDDSKMVAARESLAKLTHHLNEDDRFGVVLFNNSSHIAKPLNPVKETDMDAIRRHIREVESGGGTDMESGYSKAVEMLEPHVDSNSKKVENRVIFMTDAMPNTGHTGRNAIGHPIEEASEKGIYTTFIGMGLDANQDLIESLSKIRGANHYFIHSVEEFEQRMDGEFEYMVTPLVFDLNLEVGSDGYEIEEVYGSPNADESTGEIMNVTTLFPSPKKEGETRGGVVLLKMNNTGSENVVTLEANWVERDGTKGNHSINIDIPDTEPDYYDNSGIRKAVLLSRYGRLMRQWIENVRSGDTPDSGKDDWVKPDKRSEWEQESVPLKVPDEYKKKFEEFRQYFENEKEILGDEDLEQEEEVLEYLI